MCWLYASVFCFCFKQKTAYEMRISDWSSDVCSSDLGASTLMTTSPVVESAAGPPSVMLALVVAHAAAALASETAPLVSAARSTSTAQTFLDGDRKSVV